MSDRIDFGAIDPTADAEGFSTRVTRIARLAAERGVRPTLSMQIASLWRFAIPAAAALTLAVLLMTRSRPPMQPIRVEPMQALLTWGARGDAQSVNVLLASLDEGAHEN